MLSVLRTAEAKTNPLLHFHHEDREEKKKWTLNTITIGKQLINRIGRKATHPKIFTILSLRGAQATRQSSPNRPHKHRPPPCIRTSDHPLSLRATKWRGNPAEPPPQASPATMHTHLGPPPCHCEPQSGAAIQRNRSVTRGYPHSPWIATSGLKETLLAMTKSYYIVERV
jgi:hypothetical protein